jgi:hypothetical protein
MSAPGGDISPVRPKFVPEPGQQCDAINVLKIADLEISPPLFSLHIGTYLL